MLLTPDAPEVGLTFHSRSWTVASGRPGLTLVAQPAFDSEPPAGDVEVGDVDPEIVQPAEDVAVESEDIPETDPTAGEDGQSSGDQTGSSPGKVDPPEEDEEELEIQDNIAEDAGAVGAGEDEEPPDVDGSLDRCGAGLVAPSVLMLLAFRVVMARIAVCRRP